jgi:hypothetical protein
MKNLAFCVAVIFVFALCSIAVQAQSNMLLKADIPFDFTVGNSHLAAGTYYLDAAGMQAQRLRSADRATSQFLLTIPMRNAKAGPDNYVLKFVRYGSECFLSEIWTGNTGYQLRPTVRQSQLAKAGGAEPTVVAMQWGK